MKNSDIFHISTLNIDCGYSLEPPRRDGSNEYHKLCFWAIIRKHNVYPCEPQFYYIKVGFKGVKISWWFVYYASIVNNLSKSWPLLKISLGPLI